MDRATAVQDIQRGLGFRTDLEEEIILALQEAQRHFEKGIWLPEFLVEEDAPISIVASTRTTALPTDFLRTKSGEGPHFTNSEGGITFIQKGDFGYLQEVYATTEAGAPKAYALRKDTFYWFPEPDVAYTPTWSYYKKGDLLTTNIENVWLENAPHLLIGRAGMRIAADIGNAEAVQKFSALLAEGMKDLDVDDIERDAADYTYRMGGG